MKAKIGPIEKWIRHELAMNADDYIDCGEVQRTQLGEAYAAAHDIGETIPEEVWDAAHNAATWYEERTA